jgi:hypothetical protein
VLEPKELARAKRMQKLKKRFSKVEHEKDQAMQKGDVSTLIVFTETSAFL